MIYSIHASQDPYTFVAPDAAIAFAVSACLGGGGYMMEPLEPGGIAVPAFIGEGSTEKWCQRTFGQSPADLVATITTARLGELADALESVCLGGVKDRAELTFALQGLQPIARDRARGQWHDARRSSMNDLGRQAWRMGELFRQRVTTGEAA